MSKDLSLIALAAWLHRQSEQAKSSAEMDADEYGMRATLETAAHFAQASRVVKEAADRERGGQTQKPKPSAANEA